MKKIVVLMLVLCLILLCGCSANNTADLAAAKDSGASGIWYANMFGFPATLTLNDDLSCSMEVEGDTFSYKGTWIVNGERLTLKLSAFSSAQPKGIPLDELPFSFTADTLTLAIDGAEFFTFTREMVTAIEVAPVRTDVVLDDFIGVWQAEMLSLNDIILELNGVALLPSDFGADMTVSIGTTSVAVDIAAQSDTTYIFPLEFVDGSVKMTLEHMEMIAQLHTDGMMSISGITPLHDIVFTTDAPLIVYLRPIKEELK